MHIYYGLHEGPSEQKYKGNAAKLNMPCFMTKKH